MKQSYASKREDIFARYEAEMAAFAAEHSDRVKRLFALVHRGSHTRQSDGWLIDGTSESVRLVPILPEPIAAAMLEQRAIGQSTH